MQVQGIVFMTALILNFLLESKSSKTWESIAMEET